MPLLQMPTVDLSSFFTGDDVGQKNVLSKISQACSDYGFFQIVNHGLCLDLMNRALEISRVFFESPTEEKLKCSPRPGASPPAGYNRKPNPEYEFSEYFIMFPPGSDFNRFPPNLPQLREVMEELFSQFLKTASVISSILIESLGLPQSIDEGFNFADRSSDLLIALFYLSAKEKENMGVNPHKDVSCFTMVLQDEVGGLGVEKDGEWLPLGPTEGALIVNIADVLQVLTNDKFKSPNHRVLRPKARSRSSFAFFHDLPGKTWLEPLPEFTREIGELPKYRKFLYKDYKQMRVRNKSNPHSRLEDEITISHYAIASK